MKWTHKRLKIVFTKKKKKNPRLTQKQNQTMRNSQQCQAQRLPHRLQLNFGQMTE